MREQEEGDEKNCRLGPASVARKVELIIFFLVETRENFIPLGFY